MERNDCSRSENNMSDEKIRNDVLKHLRWNGRLGITGLDAAVRDGTVVLTGRVPTCKAKHSAEVGCLHIVGVRTVQNELEIVPAGNLPTDEEVRMNLIDLFLWNGDVGSDNIAVTISDGAVTLQGSVGSYWEKVEAEELASGIRGVRHVRNHLAVVPAHDMLDEEISDAIISALERNRSANPQDVHITVRYGRVTLSGSVPTWCAYQAALDAAAHTRGVVEVKAELELI
jgi:osmotically-inducible protein OsmY